MEQRRPFAGGWCQGNPGFEGDGGPASRALVNRVVELDFDGVGNLYFVDSGNDRIRKIDASGNISTVVGSGTKGFAGDGGPAKDARINGPLAVAVSSAGVIYFGDSGNGRIRRVGLDGTVSTIAGNEPRGRFVDGAEALDAPVGASFWIAKDPSGGILIASPCPFGQRA